MLFSIAMEPAQASSESDEAHACRYLSNSLQLMKKKHRGSEQTKRHFWLRSFEPQMGQNSHQFSCWLFSEDVDRFMACLREALTG
jgi:hypothetical protein